MRFIVIILLFISVSASAQQSAKSAQNTDSLQKELAKTKATIERAAQTQYRYFVIKTANNAYGYEVYADGQLYIHQATIPALPGNSGFTDTAKAGATARLVIKKIKQGEMPPTITVAELKKIKVIQ